MRRMLSLIVCLFLFTSTSSAQTVSTMTVLGTDRDNTLIENISGAASNGASDGVFAGKVSSGGLRRGVIHFDVDGLIPAGARIESVSLTLEVVQANGGTMFTGLHRLQGDWGEAGSMGTFGNGGGGGPSQTGDATWLHRFFATSFWTSPGGDFDSAPSAILGVTTSGPQTWTSAQMAVDVQDWLDNPLTNFGWLLMGDEKSSGVARKFASRENANTALRPKLTVSYVERAGSGEDFILSGSINGPLAFNPNMTATANDFMLLHLESPMGGYDFFPHVLCGQLYVNGSPPFQSPFFPELYLDFSPGVSSPVIYLYSAFTNQFSLAFLPPGGQTFGFVIPAGLTGMSFMIQGYSSLGSVNMGNPSFTATDAFSLQFI